MTFEFKVDKTNRKVELQIKNLTELTTRGIRQGFFRLGSALKKDLNDQVLEKNKTGKVYIVRTRGGQRGSGRARRHQSSAPGQTPANLTGNYRRNIGYQIHGSDQLQFGIRDGAEYATFLESGTSRMRPRPGLGNTVKKMQGQANEYFSDSLKKELTHAR